MNLTVITPPSEEPVAVDEVKDWSRITDDAEDAVLEGLIRLARQSVEQTTQRALLTQTLVQRWDCWPSCMEMVRAPVQSVTSLQYIDVNGVTQTVSNSNYFADLYSEPARIVPLPSYCWPLLQWGRPSAVILTYVAGLDDPSDVPEGIKMAMKMLVDHWYEHRGAVITGSAPNEIPGNVRDLLWPYRIP